MPCDRRWNATDDTLIVEITNLRAVQGPAVERLNQSPFGSVVVTDTLPQRPERGHISNLQVLSSARLFSEAIKSIHNEDSISLLFEIQH